jgi:hypothetical protein
MQVLVVMDRHGCVCVYVGGLCAVMGVQVCPAAAAWVEAVLGRAVPHHIAIVLHT